MQGIEVLYWAISVVFCLAMVFAILLWCRSWRKEEHEANTRQISGDWKFDNGKMILTLPSSFPIAGDIGVTDSLFVSILNDQMSLQTQGGNNSFVTAVA